jgi:hypothetical protein
MDVEPYDDEEEEEEEEDDDDDKLDELDVPFLVAGRLFDDGVDVGGGPKRDRTVEGRPPDDLVWDDDAILDCWNMTVASHGRQPHPPDGPDDDGTTADPPPPPSPGQFAWKAPVLVRGGRDVSGGDGKGGNGDNGGGSSAAADLLGRWEPRTLSIPLDPPTATTKEKQDEEEEEEKTGLKVP